MDPVSISVLLYFTVLTVAYFGLLAFSKSCQEAWEACSLICFFINTVLFVTCLFKIITSLRHCGQVMM